MAMRQACSVTGHWCIAKEAANGQTTILGCPVTPKVEVLGVPLPFHVITRSDF